jgi:serine/threonine-protein kinase
MAVTPARTSISIAAISALIACLACPRANAQNASAEAMFDDGVKLMKEGKVGEACEAFETSNRIEARAGTLIRIGECREANHQLASAWSAYKDALTRVKDPKKRKIATARVAELEPKLSYLTVTVTAKARLDGLEVTRDGKLVDPGLWNVAVPVDGGDFAIAASAPGHAPWKQAVSVPQDHGKISLAVPELAAVAAPPLTAPAGAAPAASGSLAVTAREAPADQASTFTTRRKVALAVFAVGVAATVGGVVLGTSANHGRDDAYALCPDPAVACTQAARASSLIDSAHTRAYEADAAYAVGAAAAITAAVLWFTGGPEHAQVGVAATAGAHGAGVSVSGRF